MNSLATAAALLAAAVLLVPLFKRLGLGSVMGYLVAGVLIGFPSSSLWALFGVAIRRLLADPRTGPHFKPANQQRVKEQLVDQFCVVIGGPCVYKGADMKSSHAELDITKSDFNALVEVLQQAMDAQGIAFGAQNQLLAALAPMHRDVITIK